jgi:hypothetical protein
MRMRDWGVLLATVTGAACIIPTLVFRGESAWLCGLAADRGSYRLRLRRNGVYLAASRLRPALRGTLHHRDAPCAMRDEERVQPLGSSRHETRSAPCRCARLRTKPVRPAFRGSPSLC